jgi:hypothetical protein
MAWVVRRAHAAADTHAAVQMTADPRVEASNGDATTDIGQRPPKRPDPSSDDSGVAAQSTPHPAEGIAVDLRTELLERHRREWGAARRLLYRSLVESEKAIGFDVAKFAKITAETIELIQRGEARAWGLDVLIIDFDSLTNAQLEAVVKHGRILR